MNERRIARLQEQIKQRLAEILQRDLADPKLGMVTITRIQLDAEFTHCKAYWSVFAPSSVGEARARAASEAVLDRARGFCQREVGKSLNTRTIPRLEFVFDEGIAGAIRVNQLLKDLQPNRPADPDAPAGADSDAPPSDSPGDPGDSPPPSR
jgi:ribosome-binding factor A